MSTKKNLNLSKEELEIPEGIEVEIDGQMIRVKNGSSSVEKKMPNAKVTKESNKLVISMPRSTKREKKQVNAIKAHIKNMFLGLNNKYIYKLQVCSVHFPMNLTIKDNYLLIKNFLGETKERKAAIVTGAEVQIERDIITVSSSNKESAGQTTANIEKATRTKHKDRRVFQDGIYMIEKPGKIA